MSEALDNLIKFEKLKEIAYRHGYRDTRVETTIYQNFTQIEREIYDGYFVYGREKKSKERPISDGGWA